MTPKRRPGHPQKNAKCLFWSLSPYFPTLPTLFLHMYEWRREFLCPGLLNFPTLPAFRAFHAFLLHMNEEETFFVSRVKNFTLFTRLPGTDPPTQPLISVHLTSYQISWCIIFKLGLPWSLGAWTKRSQILCHSMTRVASSPIPNTIPISIWNFFSRAFTSLYSILVFGTH